MPGNFGNLPLIAIVGRPNVGKSALFNNIVGRRISIVHEESGVTRDRIVAPAEHKQCHFELVDTGGVGVLMGQKKVEVFDELVRRQVQTVVGDAVAVIFVVDVQAGTAALDREMAAFLRQQNVPVILAANKADNPRLDNMAVAEFAELGFTPVWPISCSHNRGIHDLLDCCVEHLPVTGAKTVSERPLQLAVVGRPNVGKSSIVNCLLGEDRVIVSDLAGTTRDAVDVPFEIRDKSGEIVPVTFVDTAGLRKKRRVDSAVEFYSVSRAENAIKRSDVVLLVVDASDPGAAQDRRIGHLIASHRKPCIVVANKWDLVSAQMKKADMLGLVRHFLPFMEYAPLEVISAADGRNVESILERLLILREQMGVKIPTSLLNQFLEDLTMRTPPPSKSSKSLKIFYGTMAGNPPPHFIFFVNDKRICPTNYLQFLENRLREAFFPEAGLPIWLELRSRRSEKETEEGTRRAIGGVMRHKKKEGAAALRHKSRRKGWRK